MALTRTKLPPQCTCFNFVAFSSSAQFSTLRSKSTTDSNAYICLDLLPAKFAVEIDSSFYHSVGLLELNSFMVN